MKTVMQSIGMIAMAGLLSFCYGCKSDASSTYGSAASPTTSAPSTIVMANLAFSPTTLTIKKGTTITWKNNDAYVHTSTSDSGVWDSGDIAGGGSRTTTFATAGTFPFHCTYHGSMGMTGTIIVQ
jgi:plastocyanin